MQRIYGELDLLISECLNQGVWNGLTPAELAAVASGLTYTSRNIDDAPPPQFVTQRSRDVANQMGEIHLELAALERRHRLRFLRDPDFAFAQGVGLWADGAPLHEVLSVTGLAAGDFVRSIKQLVDALAQIAVAAGDDSAMRSTARRALDGLRRGVISYS